MKKTILISLTICFLIIFSQLQSQVDPMGRPTKITIDGTFDKVGDRFGNTYNLVDLSLSKIKPFGGPATVNSLPTQSCSAGYFNLYFEPGSIFTTNLAAQTVLCEVFRNLSGFINSPLSLQPNVGPKINIYCADTPTSSPGAGGTASPVFIFPFNPASPYPGIVDQAIYKAILSGNDPYTQLPSSIGPWANNYYHGYVNANPAMPWTFNMGIVSIGSNELDFYTVMLHEVTHALGFGSLIDGNGVSKFGAGNNYYARYDLFLKYGNGTALLTSLSPSCSPMNNLAFLGSTLALAPGTCTGTPVITSCSSAIQYSSTNTNAKVYTPGCFAGGSSFSHFEDMCTYGTFTTTCIPTPTAPGYNDLYYVMSDATSMGSCFVKRYLKEEEKAVLCDLGYSVNLTYTSNAVGATHTYSSSCSPVNVIGRNDGFVSGVYTYTSSSATLSISLASILSNDFPTSGLSVSCFESVYNNAAVSISGSSLVVAPTAGANCGFIMLKYLPKNTSTGLCGNPTYIFTYFLSASCAINACDMVQNGGFENLFGGSSCGMFNGAPGDPKLGCWDAYEGTPDLYYRYSSSPTYFSFNMPLGSIPENVNSYNGSAPNNRYVGMSSAESMQNSLNAPLIPGQTYKVSLFAMNYSDPSLLMNPNCVPMVFVIASRPSYATPIFSTSINYYPFGQNILAQFTVNPCKAWTALTQTFVFTPTVTANHSVLLIGIDNTYYTNALTDLRWAFIDDVSLVPVTNAGFSIPNAQNCGNISFTNLAQYAPPIPGAFSGPGVSQVTTTSGITYNFNSPPNASITTGSYPIAFTYTASNGCVNTLWQTIIIAPTATLSASGSSSYCIGSSIGAALTATCPTCSSGATYNWQPGNITGSLVAVTPSVYTTYTVSITNATCMVTQTLAVSILTTCCPANAGVFTSNSVNMNTTINGPMMMINSFTVQPNTNFILAGGDYAFNPNVKITVASGAILEIKDSHLYTCGSSMWQGIDVLPGGKIYVHHETKDNLIEDAVTAINVDNHTASSVTDILSVTRTTFNKNYVDINISNYNKVTTTYPFIINNCVFTCRNLSYTVGAWPQTGTVSSASTPSADLRYVNTSLTPTTGLASPYLNQSTFSITTLKSPYSSQPSHIAIQINSVGVTSGTIMAGAIIGSSGAASDFNLFDAHGIFISALNSHVSSVNNVFQNTQTYSVSGIAVGGSAISHSTASVFNTRLIVSGLSVNTGNRFWNCHKGVDAKNTYSLSVENALFRSMQSSTNIATFLPGNTGINASTNRFTYYIANNEFTNIKTGINIPLSAGAFSSAGTSFTSSGTGLYADKMRIVQNVFTGSVSGQANSYMNDAVNITNPNAVPWNAIINNSISPVVNAVAVNTNTFAEVHNAIKIDGVKGFPAQANNNKIRLKFNATYGPQYGIRLANCNPAGVLAGVSGSSGSSKSVLAENTLSFTSVPSVTSGALISCDHNGYSLFSPSITCNTLAQASQGFVFDGFQLGTIWAGNTMQPLTRGLVLNNHGGIGVQGSTTTAIGNVWNGTWTGFHTYVGASSDASTSVMYVKNISACIPTNNGGVSVFQSYAQSGAVITNTTAGVGEYNCTGIPNYKVITVPKPGSLSAEMFYMDKLALYYLLQVNDSVRGATTALSTFYTNQSSTSIGKFWQIENSLYQGNYTAASSLLSEVSGELNTVEVNYKSLYTLYIAYLANNSLNSTQKTSLLALATLCPGTNGACVYQARALYNTLYNQIVEPICEEGSGARKAYVDPLTEINVKGNISNVEVFPNPAKDHITIKTGTETESLSVIIKDLRGRTVLEKVIQVKGFIAILDMELINGAYLIYMTNSQNEKAIKKLIINK